MSTRKEQKRFDASNPTGPLRQKKEMGCIKDDCRGPQTRIQRKSTGSEEVAEFPSIVHDVIRSPAQPLDAATRTFMEPRFGHDFSNVRVHADSRAAESARAVDALAYTVGRDVVLGGGQHRPGSAIGRKLLAHELMHVMQQSGASSSRPLQDRLTISQPGDAFEQEADAAVGCVMSGAQSGVSHTCRALAIQRQTPGSDIEKKPPEKQEAGEVLVEGLKTVAEQAMDNNPKVKKGIVDPIKDKLKGEWNRLGTGGQAATIGLGAATLGMAGGAMLSDPGGRKRLEGVNLAAPLTLIPYMPLDNFKYTLPSGDSPDKRLFKFETGFKADDLINLRTESRGLPKMSLAVNMQWGFDPATERLSILGGDASLGIVPGLSLSAGVYKDVLRPPQTLVGQEGQTTQIKKSVPEFDKPQPIPDVRIMLTVDLMKFKPGDLLRQIKGLL